MLVVWPCPVGAPERQGLCRWCCDHGSLSTAENSHDAAIPLLILGDNYERKMTQGLDMAAASLCAPWLH